jgi:SAM-dependent methyltransferase
MEYTPAERLDPLKLLDYVPASVARALDCGGPSGPLVKGLEARGVAVEQVDPVDPGGRNALPLAVGDDAHECVICVDVLARVRDAEPLARELARVLAPGGLLLATVPNAQFYRVVLGLTAGEWVTTEDGVITRDHLRFFTAFEAVTLLRKMDLEIRGLLPVAGVEPADVPLDAGGCIVHDNVRLGPLNGDAYRLHLASQLLVIATRPG